MGHGRGQRSGCPAPLRPGRVRYSPGERQARARAAQAADGSLRQHFQYRGAMYRLAACPTCGQAVYLVLAAAGPLRAEDQSQPWDGHGCLHAQDGSAAAEGWAAVAVLARHQDPLAAGWALVEAVRCDPDGAAGDAALTSAQVYRLAGDHRAAVKAYREALTVSLPAYALRAAVGLLDPDLRGGDTAADLPGDAPRMVLHAGRVLARLGMPAHAAAMYGLLRGGGDPPYAAEAERALARLAGWDRTTATPGEAVQVLADLDASRGGHNPHTDRGPQPAVLPSV